MVVFTCNNCGESLQKPRVIKHISYECKKRSARVSLCCIDCLKDFDSNTYTEHTKCFTELERYSGGNYIPKASANKGERKQNSWINVVRSVLNQPSLSHNQRELLQAISHFENVPRKKAKFQNFIRSSLKSLRVQPHVVDTVFELIEKEFKNSVTSTAENTSRQQNGDAAEKRGKSEENDNKAQVCEGGNAEEKNETVQTDEIEPVIKKKKKKKKSDDSDVTLENGNNSTVSDENRKKKRKMEYDADEVNGVDNNSSNIDDSSQVVKKKKKNKFEDTANDNACEDTNQSVTSKLPSNEDADSQKVNEVLESNTEENPGAKLRKKKKRKSETTNGTENGTEGDKELTTNVCGENEQNLATQIDTEQDIRFDQTATFVKKSKLESVSDADHQDTEKGEEGAITRFDWKDIVISILQKSENHEVSLKKMKKKIVRKYLQFHQDEKPAEDILKKFNKRVKKIVNVEMTDEKIRLLE